MGRYRKYLVISPSDAALELLREYVIQYEREDTKSRSLHSLSEGPPFTCGREPHHLAQIVLGQADESPFGFTPPVVTRDHGRLQFRVIAHFRNLPLFPFGEARLIRSLSGQSSTLGFAGVIDPPGQPISRARRDGRPDCPCWTAGRCQPS
jgi:hypothetical protein